MKNTEKEPLIRDNFVAEGNFAASSRYGAMNNGYPPQPSHSLNDLNGRTLGDFGFQHSAHHMTVISGDETLNIYGYRQNPLKTVSFVLRSIFHI